MAADRRVEEQIARTLRAQNAAIGYDQLIGVGLSRAAVRARVARGALVAVFHRVYVAGDPSLLPRAREAAALLSLGPHAVISHRSAAVLWEIADPDGGGIHVTVGSHNPRAQPGLVLHHARLDAADIRTRHNLRITSPARSLIDFAAQAGSSEVESAFGEARANRLVSDASLNAALERAPANHPGAAIIRRWLRDDPGGTYTRSSAERRVRSLMKAAELPQPLVNVRLLGFTADFLWPQQRLILEVDGYDTHGTRLAFEGDRRRDQVHVAAGYTVIRVTWRQLCFESYAVVARVAQALSLRAA